MSWYSSLLVTRIVSSFSVVSLVQDLQSACHFPLAPSTQWSRQTEVGHHLTDWGLPSVRQMVADQWDYEDSPHHQRQPIVLKPMPISLDLKLITAASCVVSATVNSGTAVTSPGCKPRQSVWRSCGFQSSESPSQPHQCGPRESRAVHLALTWLQELLEGSLSQQSNCLRGPTAGFSSRFAPEAFSMTECGCKAAEVWNWSFPSSRWTAFPG